MIAGWSEIFCENLVVKILSDETTDAEMNELDSLAS